MAPSSPDFTDCPSTRPTSPPPPIPSLYLASRRKVEYTDNTAWSPVHTVVNSSVAGKFIPLAMRTMASVRRLTSITRDSLKRHVRMHERGRRLRRKSCDRCQRFVHKSFHSHIVLKYSFRSKIRCSGTRPQCTACSQRGVVCNYTNVQLNPQNDEASRNLDTQSKEIPSLVNQQDSNQPPTPLSELFTNSDSFLPDTEAVLELDPNDLYFDPGAVNPDWILSSFDLWPHLDTFDLPTDCEIFDPPGSIISLPVGTQMASPNAQEPPAKYNARHGPQLDNWLLSVDNDTLVLPQLGGDNDKSLHLGSHFQVPKVQEARRVDMQNCAQMMLERPLWKAVSLANLPSKAKMDHCIDLFFINFRPVSNEIVNSVIGKVLITA